MAKTFDIDAAIANDRPSVILRKEEYLFADLKLREKISRARHLQAKQEALEKQEQELDRKIQDSVWTEDEDISEDEIKEQREDIAEKYADVVEELIKLTVVKPVYQEGEEDKPVEDRQYQHDENFRIVTEPFPDDVLKDLTELEVQGLNAFVEKASDEGIDPKIRGEE